MQLPSSLLRSLQNIPGFDEDAFTAVHQSGDQITSVRFNQKKTFGQQRISSVMENISGKIPWSENGYYLSGRPSFTLDPLFHAGAYYVQEASSMFLEEVVKQSCDLLQPLRVLDLCAAPGGKSTLLQSLISDESLLVSNEVIRPRANILTENITKWGVSNVVVTNNDPKDFQRLSAYFDLIVIDAPCSGSGLFRKDPEAISEWSLDNVALCSQRQQRILADIFASLKPGGVLVYSTCSYSSEEDEDICDWLLEGFSQSLSTIKLTTDPAWNIVETLSSKHNAYGYRFYPDKVKGEGFFIAAFKNVEEASPHRDNKPKNKPELISKQALEYIRPFITEKQSFSYFNWKDEIIGVPSVILSDIFILQSVLYLKKAGTKIGTLIRQELVPDHELAVSNLISDNVPFINADLETSLQYLRRSEVLIESSLRGWTIIKFNDLPLGWIKILPNRINNYYPREWRILNK